MNMVNYNFSSDLEYEYLAWWFFRRDSSYHSVTKHCLDQAVKSFFRNDMRCIPSFSFISFTDVFKKLIEEISFDYPTLRIKTVPMFLAPNFRDIQGISNIPLEYLLKISNEDILSRSLSQMNLHIDAAHISQVFEA